MDIFTGKRLEELAKNNTRCFQELLPELVKRLIINSCPNITQIRIPSNDDIWAPGFDGVVENTQASEHVCAGTSVWEIGTNANSLKKIEDDYIKRTENSLGIEKEKTEFYFVVPYVWAYKNTSLPQWEFEHSCIWKKAHVFDAPILAEWLNTEPAVCAWLLEKIGEKNYLDFSSVETAWDVFSSKTNPALSKAIFVDNRDEQISAFINILNNPIVRVKAETLIDSYGFCLTALLSRCDLLNSVVVINDFETYKRIARFCRGKTFLLNFRLDGDIIEGNKVILCFNKEDTSVKEDILINQQSKQTFEKSIQKMGISEDKAKELYRHTRGNLWALIRRIPGNMIERYPKWAKQDDIHLLAPVMLLRSFNTKGEYDKNLIAFLAGEQYETVIQRYHSWMQLEDYPIKPVEDYIILINFEEAWEVLKLKPSLPIFERLISAIKMIVEQKDGTVFGNCLPSSYEYSQRINNLFLALIFFANDADGDGIVDKAICELLKFKPFPSIIFDRLHMLSEASPLVVMSFLEKDIQSNQSITVQAFKEVYYSSNYCNVLSSLEELVLHEETRFRACDMLFHLCLQTQDMHFRYSNTPRETLQNVLCLWNDYTLFSIEDKEKIVMRYLEDEPDFMISFSVDLLLKNNMIIGVHNWKQQRPNTSVYYNDLHETQNRISKYIFQLCVTKNNIECLKKLLAGYRCFYPETLIESAKLFEPKNYSTETLVAINYDLRKKVFYAKNNADNKLWIPALQAWVSCTTPQDDLGKVGWMFYDYYDYRLNYLIEDERKKNKDISDKLKIRDMQRMKAFERIEKCCNPEKLVSLVLFSKDEYAWGVFYSKKIKRCLMPCFFEEALKCEKLSLLGGLLDEADVTDCVQFLNSISKDKKLILFNKMNRIDIAENLDHEEEAAFWTYKTMRSYNELCYQKLLTFNPFGLLSYYAYIVDPPLKIHFDNIMDVFESIISFLSRKYNCYTRQETSYSLAEIISNAEKEGIYSERWAKLCATLYDLDLLPSLPETLKRYYYENPCLLIEKATQGIKTAWNYRDNYTLPECAYEDEAGFMFFIDSLLENQSRSNHLISLVGGILGKSIEGSDGLYPHEFVRVAMEKYKHLNLKNAVLVGELNAREARWVQDGSGEKAYAAECQKKARLFDIDFPETAQLWRMIGSDYSEEGKRDHVYSEISLI